MIKKQWKTVSLDTVCNLVGGGTPSKSKQEYYTGDIHWATVRDMNVDFLEKTELSITEQAVNESSTNIIPKGNVIIATRVGLGKVCILNQDTAINQDLKGVIPKDNLVSSEFLFWWFKNISDEIIDAGTGLTVQGVKLPFVKKLQIPSLSLTEQKQIVALLDQAFKAIDQAQQNIEKNIANAKELFQSKLNTIFSQTGEGWEERTIEEVTNVINGYSFKSGDFSTKNELRSIKITNVGVKEFVEENDNYLPISFAEKHQKVKVKEGDLVLALTRTIISSGLKIALVPKSYDGALLNQRVAAIIPDNNQIDLQYLYYYCSTKIVYNYVLDHVNTLMQPNLSIKDLKKMPIPLCSLEQQKQIKKQVDHLTQSTDKLIKKYNLKLDNLEELKKSILQKAFNGERVGWADVRKPNNLQP